MNPEQRQSILDRLLECGSNTADPESSHIMGDKILCEALVALGYSDLVEAWEAISKWYA